MRNAYQSLRTLRPLDTTTASKKRGCPIRYVVPKRHEKDIFAAILGVVLEGLIHLTGGCSWRSDD